MLWCVCNDSYIQDVLAVNAQARRQSCLYDYKASHTGKTVLARKIVREIIKIAIENKPELD